MIDDITERTSSDGRLKYPNAIRVSRPPLRGRRRLLKIAVIGDVHDLWEAADELALKHLGVDLVLFVGDFGNEAVELIRQIAAIELPKAIILGNHDAWYSASPWGKKKAPYDRTKEDRIQQQLDLLSSCHVGYGKLDFVDLNLSVVGGRPFSWGGQEWKNADFYRNLYQVDNFEESTAKIVETAKDTVCDTLIFIGHNGPYGLGNAPESSCGKDWHPIGGDCGDPDLREAIDRIKSLGKTVPFVTFGHMHHRLRHRQDRLRTRINIDGESTIYLNSACVPRIKEDNNGKQRSFSLVTLNNDRVSQVSLVWLDEEFAIFSEEILYSDRNLDSI
jgi:uncharacterized protein (TIGR04168 family)